MNPFNPLEVSLQGHKLIESSAGTGKTHAIASLYVRLLLERRLQTREILVVTFTEAATEDLRSRIRQRVREALNAFESFSDQDTFFTELIKKTEDRHQAQWVLLNALRTFDEAAIFTIHGFCQRMLQESAFESGSLFDTELITDQSRILQEIVDDFWRIHYYQASSLLFQYTLKKKLTPDALYRFLGRADFNPFLNVIPQVARPSPEILSTWEDKLFSHYNRVGSLWDKCRREVESLLMNCEGLNRNSYSETILQRGLLQMEQYLSSGNPILMENSLEKFCAGALAQGVRRGFSSPQHEFFEIFEQMKLVRDELVRNYDLTLLAHKVELIHYVKTQLKERKQRGNIRSFDDLLQDLYHVLQSQNRKALARAIRDRHKAALIDEFQDTDPVQYAIFKATYPEDRCLFLIGDPKQAIYSFRGADIFAYMKAAEDVSDQYTLSKNWRSTPNLVTAVNGLFKRASNPFVFTEIRFHEVEAASTEIAKELTWEGKPDPAPFKIWFMERESGKTINKEEAYKVLPEAVSSEIVRLLNAGKEGAALVEGKPLSPWDIAVLVRTNHEAKLVQEALSKRRVPSVLYSNESVFNAHETMEVERVLTGIADPAHEARVKAALSTDILGINGNELARLSEEDASWDAWLKRFVDYHDLWIDRGFITMAQTLIARENVRSRLLTFPNGERRLTNLFHCFELLHDAVLEHKLGVEGLLKWLAEKRQDETTAPVEEHQIRLETDEKAVKIVTIHKSKGLEYPIVFCPFCWNSPKVEADSVVFHDDRGHTAVFKDIGSDNWEANRKRALKEGLAEEIRLLYVALTRPKYRCYLVWGAFRDAGKSSLAYLLHSAGGKNTNDNWPESVNTHFEQSTDQDIKADLYELVRESAGTIELLRVPATTSIMYVPQENETKSYLCRQFSGTISQDWGISSFTYLVSAREHGLELLDRDAISEGENPIGESSLLSLADGLTVSGFPRGARAGIFFHEIFHDLDFSNEAQEAQKNLVRKKLSEYGYELIWQEPICQMIRNVLSTPLERDRATFFLSNLSPTQHLHEVEFTFPLELLNSNKLKRVFAAHHGPELPKTFPELLNQLEFTPVQGLMRGYMDMVFQWQGKFYLIDWKSNFLGTQAEAYGQEALRQVMERQFYILQYYLYCVALDRYLCFRMKAYDYKSHFGGVFYVFLRGVDPKRGSDFGIYRDRPSRELITELSHCLAGR